MMSHHAQSLRRVAGDQNALSLRQQMADEISDGVRLAGSRRALNQDASVFFQLLRDANLFGVGGFAEQNVYTGFGYGILGSLRLGGFGIRNRRFFTNNIKEGPRQVLAGSKVGKNSFNRGGVTQRAGTEENDRVAANAGIELFTVRRAFFNEFATRRELHDHALQEIRSGAVIKRMKAALLDLLTAAADGATVHVSHG